MTHSNISRPATIAFVIDQLGVGGTERQLANLLHGLDQNLFKPLLVTIHEYEVCFDVPCEKNLFKTGKMFSPTALKNLFHIATLFRRNNVQIVQTFFLDSAIMGVLAARLARVPIVVLSRRDMGFWQTPIRLATLRLLERMSDRILVNSDCVRNQVAQRERAPLDKIDVLYNGIDCSLFDGNPSPAEARKAMGIPADSPVVGIVANMNRDVKRVDLFLDAAGLLTKTFPDAKFVIVGEGHLRGRLEARSQELGLNGAVKFAGGVKSIPAFLQAFDVGVNCSESEGLSNAVIEYMAAGLPAVVSAIPGNCELVTDGVEGCHFPSGDAVSLAERIGVLLRNPGAARAMGAKGREKALRLFSAENTVRLHTQYYQKLLHSQP